MRWTQKLLAGALLALSACTAADGPDRVVEPRGFEGAAPRGDAQLRQAMQRGHDTTRAAVGLPRLTWSDDLATAARGYAQELARTGRFEHSPESFGAKRTGENLWTGTRDAYRYEEMVAHWVAEKRHYLHRPVPDFSATGRWQDVAHYGQVVSRRTTRFGCALASGTRDDFLVCRYDPPGNLIAVTVY